ncbi:MAG: hypothetical protein IJ571_10380 [Ruminococcus sp.]|nr:hypothetical protein [Ruminococcus sp.]
MKKRRLFGIICFVLAMACYGCCTYVTYITYTNIVSEVEGFLIFILLWIGAYWFSTFFTQLIRVSKSDGSKEWLISKRGRKLAGDTTAVISAALICFWIYFYVSRYTSLLSFMNK